MENNNVELLSKKRQNPNNKNDKKKSAEIIKSNLILAQEKLKELANDKDNLAKLSKLLNKSNEYDKIKFRDKIFKIGDVLLVQAENEVLIGELINIIPKNGNQTYPFWPTLQVKWYYKKTDIDRKKNNLLIEKNYNSLSNFELFKSNHVDNIFIESIINKCEIYTYEEYDKLVNPGELAYFSRAKYDPKKGVLIPKFDSWKKYCVCKTPLNPDQLYIICDKCNNPFHPECCNINKDECSLIENFICPFCKKKQ